MTYQQKAEWTEDKRFEAHGMVVQVNRLDLLRRPHYSLAIFRLNRDNNPTRYLPVISAGTGQVTIDPITQQIADLVQRAEDYVLSALQEHENRWVEKAAEREQDQIARDKPQQRRGIGSPGKTARDRDRKKGATNHG